jgi:hypothetical protein
VAAYCGRLVDHHRSAHRNALEISDDVTSRERRPETCLRSILYSCPRAVVRALLKSCVGHLGHGGTFVPDCPMSQFSDQKSRAQRADVLFCERLDFSLDEVDDASRDNADQQGDALWDRMRVGEQTVERDDRRQCQERWPRVKKGDAAGSSTERLERRRRQWCIRAPSGAMT